jgi:hypothetical protein
MLNIKSILILFCVLTISLTGIAQEKNIKKAAAHIQKGKYKSALKSSEKALKQNNKSQAALIYKSMALFNLYKSPSTAAQYPNGLKESIKTAEKAFDLGKEEYLRENFGSFIQQIIEENNKEAEKSFKAERYVKASQHYKLNLGFNPKDTFSLYRLGSCYWLDNQKNVALPYLKSVAALNHSAFLDSNALGSYQFKVFRFLAEYYMKSQQWDSANLYLTMGFEIFPNDHVLQGHKYGLYRVQTQNFPPSLNYLEKVRNILIEYPTDSFYLMKENALYIFLFKQGLKYDNEKQADSLLGIFVQDRMKRFKSPNLDYLKKIDVFIDENPEKIFFNLLKYAAQYYHKDIFNWLVDKWVSETLHKDKVSSKEYLELSARTFQEQSKTVGALMLLNEFNRTSRKIENEKLITDLASLWSQSHTPVIGLDYLYQISETLFNSKNKNQFIALHRNISYTFLDSLAHGNYFFKAYELLNTIKKDFPKDIAFIQNTKRKELANLDFKMNYYGTRMSDFGKNANTGETPFFTDLFAENCEAGSLSLEILEKVADRINYFRRNSGIKKQISLSKDLNEKTQYAALMFQANKRMFHEAMEGLRCYTPIGKEGAIGSLMINSNNPALSITGMMGENKSASQGNRRWLQFPLIKNMGFGASEDFSVLWILDKGYLEDSLFFKNNFVAWPNEGYTPKMLAFGKWTFSVFDDLNGAEIKVWDSNKNDVALQVLKYETGYGMPTLVFEPKINLSKNKEDQQFEVQVKLKSGKTFLYKVILFQPEL